MTNEQIAAVLRQVTDNQLADTRTALEKDQRKIATNELEDAMRVLKQLAKVIVKKG